MVQEEDVEAGRGVQRADGLLAVRTVLERKFIAIAPPVVPGQPKAAEEWLGGLEKCLAEAMDPNHAPIEAIPWF
jgi:hypothetical protein